MFSIFAAVSSFYDGLYGSVSIQKFILYQYLCLFNFHDYEKNQSVADVRFRHAFRWLECAEHHRERGSPGKVCVLDNKFYLCRTRMIKVCQVTNKQYC